MNRSNRDLAIHYARCSAIAYKDKATKEELKELEVEIKNRNKSKIEEELGDLFLSCINLSRKLKLDTETVIRKSNRKFDKRFRKMEKIMNKNNLEWNLKNLEKIWQKVK